jgi:hypothetical protein
MNDTWTKVAADYNLLQAQRFYNNLYPNEQHNAGGDCMNPRCDYKFTPQDWQDVEMSSGWFTCPKCHYTYNYLDPTYGVWGKPGGRSRAGLTMSQMGNIGEDVIQSMGSVQTLGKVITIFPNYNNPIDAIIGPYGVEIKTNHSEAQPRFKITGTLSGGGTTRENKIRYCEEQGLQPALVGVRLNFYTSKADIFARPGLVDTWIGNPAMPHVATVDFSNLNPFPHPGDVPPPAEMPTDDSDIPF